MDGSPCSYCLQNKRTSELTEWTFHHECTDFLQSSNPLAHPCVSCSTNFKSKPWRRKSLLTAIPECTWINSMPWTTLILLLTNIFQGVFHILSRTKSKKKNSRLTPHWVLLLITLFGGIFLPLASCQERVQPTPSVKSLQLPNVVVYVGSPFTYNISESAFDCEVDSIVVSY